MSMKFNIPVPLLTTSKYVPEEVINKVSALEPSFQVKLVVGNEN